MKSCIRHWGLTHSLTAKLHTYSIWISRKFSLISILQTWQPCYSILVQYYTVPDFAYAHVHACALTQCHVQVLALIVIAAGVSSQSSVDGFSSSDPLPRNTDAAGGWLAFVSFWVILYQAIVIFQRFFNFRCINNRIKSFLIIVSSC